MKYSLGQSVGVTVETGEITNGAVTEAKIGSGAVTEAKIGSGAVTITKIGADAIDGTKIADDSIDIDHINATHAANQVLKVNSGNTALEFGTSPVDPTDNVTYNTKTVTLAQFVLGVV